MDEKNIKKQELFLQNRENLKLTQVLDVESFSENIVVADTSLGRITIKGEDLKINKLDIDDGELLVEGMVNLLEYTKRKEKVSLLKSIFK